MVNMHPANVKWSPVDIDEMGRVVTASGRDGLMLTNCYSPEGALISQKTSRDDPETGTEVWHEYDASGVLVNFSDMETAWGVMFPEGTRGLYKHYSFDAAGRQQTWADWNGLSTNVYDAADRMTAVQYYHGVYLTYGYDAVGNRLKLDDTKAGRTTYGYDLQNRVTLIWNPFDERTSITWDALDREQRRVFGNGMSTSHVYDARGNETGLMTVDSAGVALQRYTATYSRAGDRVTSKELDGSLVTYGYDGNRQLAHDARNPSPNYDNDYFYDRVGNRLRKVESATGINTTYTYDLANQLLWTQEPGDVRTTFTYDGNGNTLSENRLGQITTYAWDYENRLTGQIEPDGTRYTYTYRGNDSRRVKNETPDGNTRILVWDGLNCLQELDQSLNLIGQYTDYPGQWGGLASQRRGVDSSYYGFDLQWTGRVLVAQSQLISDTYTNDAWGVELAGTGSTVNVYRYVGQWGYRRETSKRSDVWNRQLQTHVGVWLTVDPLWMIGHKYSYAMSNPVFLYDATGLVCKHDCSSFPGGPCEYSKAKGFEGDCKGQEKRDGWVTCCEGKRYVCNYPSPGKGVGAGLCKLIHEQCHTKQRFAFCSDQTYGCLTALPDDRLNYECECYETQFSCLLNTSLCKILTSSPRAYQNCVKGMMNYFCARCDGYGKVCGPTGFWSHTAACKKLCKNGKPI